MHTDHVQQPSHADVTAATRHVVTQFFEALGAQDAEAVAGLMAEEVDWYIPGHTGLAPWLGRRRRPAEIAEVVRMLAANVEPRSVELRHLLVDGEVAVATGEFASLMTTTGKLFESEFAIQMTVRDGRIVRYRLLEEGYGLVLALTA